MEIVLTLSPEEYNLVHKGLTKLSIEEALPTLNKIVAEVQNQFNKPAIPENKSAISENKE